MSECVNNFKHSLRLTKNETETNNVTSTNIKFHSWALDYL